MTSMLMFMKKCDSFAERLANFAGRMFDAQVVWAVRGEKLPQTFDRNEFDYVISYLCPLVIPQSVLDMAKVAAINFHTGPPEYPGAGCTNFALYNQEEVYGVTCHRMEAAVDTGEIIEVVRFSVYDSDSVWSLTQRCYSHLADLFTKIMNIILHGDELPSSQEKWTRKPYTRKELDALCVIEPDMDETEIHRRVRATTYPAMPGPKITLAGYDFVLKPSKKQDNMNEKIIIIAEAGINHNGSMDMALTMVDVAADTGADVVKFQSFKADRLVAENAEKAEYQKQTSGADETQFEMLKKLELTEEMHLALIERCRERGIEFLSTPFDSESAKYLFGLGMETFKIPSGEITNLPYLRTIGSFGKKVVMSTGMAMLDEVRSALDVLVKSGTSKDDIIALQCNTEYPTPYEDANILAMRTLAEEFDVVVGYSDHTPGIEAPLAAAALGAKLIEKHFTLDKTLDGPDHQASLNPEELAAMVAGIRRVEMALGTGRKEPSPSELKNKAIARKSIVAARDIQKGEAFTAENLTMKRPGTGISPMRWDEVIGRKAGKDYKVDEIINVEDDLVVIDE